MDQSTGEKPHLQATHETNDATVRTTGNDEKDRVSAFAGREIKGLDVFKDTSDRFTAGRVQESISAMNKDVPTGGEDMIYGDLNSQLLRFWKADRQGAPTVIFVHGGSWRVGTYPDSIGSAKVNHLLSHGFAFATVNFSLVPTVTVEAQVQEIAQAIAFLAKNCDELGIDSGKIVLMRHSSGAHVVTLLGTDMSYLEKERVDISQYHRIRRIKLQWRGRTSRQSWPYRTQPCLCSWN